MTKKLQLSVIIIFMIFVTNLFTSCGGKTTEKTETTVKETETTVKETETDLSANSKISWEFIQNGEGEFGEPKNKVIMVVNGKKIVLIEELKESCNPIEPPMPVEYQMPKDAIAGFTTWWAGGGYYFYVVKNNDKFVVMRAGVDESMGEGYKLQYEKFKEFSAADLK